MKKNTAVITGAAQGIGKALAHECAQRGMQLALADIQSAALEKTIHELKASYPECEIIGILTDVSNQDSVQQLAARSISHFGRIDYLINNAGISGPLGPIWTLDPNALQKTLSINLFGTWHGIRAFVPHLLQQTTPSHIINMASMLGLCSCSKFAPYIVSKHAVVALSEVLYHDLKAIAPHIQVSVVCPSFVSTNLIEKPSDQDLPHQIANLVSQSAPPEQIAPAIMRGIELGQFYILPHPEVKKYFQLRLQDVQQHQPPTPNQVQRLLVALETCE